MKRSLPPLYNYLFTFDGELMTGSCLIKIHLMEVEPTLIEVSSWVCFSRQVSCRVLSPCRNSKLCQKSGFRGIVTLGKWFTFSIWKISKKFSFKNSSNPQIAKKSWSFNSVHAIPPSPKKEVKVKSKALAEKIRNLHEQILSDFKLSAASRSVFGTRSKNENG